MKGYLGFLCIHILILEGRNYFSFLLELTYS